MENKIRVACQRKERKRNNERNAEEEKRREEKEGSSQIASAIAEACVSGAHLLPA